MRTRYIPPDRPPLYPQGRGKTLQRFRFELWQAEQYERKGNTSAAEKWRLAARRQVHLALRSRHRIATVLRHAHQVEAILDRQQAQESAQRDVIGFGAW